MQDQPVQPEPNEADQTSVDPRVEEMRQAPLPATRYDLKISPQLYLGKTVYMVKDPVSLKYYRLRPAEYLIFRELDGKQNANTIAEKVNATFPDEETEADDVLQFVNMMRTGGLLLGKASGHAGFLRKIRDQQKTKMRRAKLMSFLFIRIPVIDPDRLLNWMYRAVSPIMNPTTMWLGLIFIGVSIVMGFGSLSQVGELAFPLLGFFNLFLITTIFFVVKVIHEFGHGLAAKHRGLEVHEMGVMLMVFMPLFYIDVSDAWMVPRKNERMWITAGGVFIEFIFASVAVWVWLYTDPGLLNQIAFDTMLSASLTTLLFNANPLLRYDGYYFLMDWLEIPNMKAKAAKYVGWLARTFILRAPGPPPADEVRHRPIFMVFYSFASAIYRWVIVFGIVVLIWHILDPYGLESIGALMGMLAIVTMILMPMFKTLRFAWSVQTQNWRRVGFTLGVGSLLALITWGVLSIEFENTVEQPTVILANHRAPIYTAVKGHIEKVNMKEGDWVDKGEVLIELKNEKMQSALEQIQYERELLSLSVNHARQYGKLNDVAVHTQELELLKNRIQYLEDKIEKLKIRAPISGRIQPEVRLHMMLGLSVEPGKKIADIIGTKDLLAVVVLPQEDGALIRQGMPVRTRLWANATQTYQGTVTRMTNQFVKQLPHEALAGVYGGEVDTMAQGDYNLSPYNPSVLAYVKLNVKNELELIDGLTGRTKIVLGRSSLGSQQWRLIKQSFALDWWL